MKALSFILLVTMAAQAQTGAVIGSKKFTESYVLAEIAKRSGQVHGVTVEHKQGMGGTIILWQALLSGEIDAYPEYTGTIAEEILKAPGIVGGKFDSALASQGIGTTKPLGFNNTYALAMLRKKAAALGIASIADLSAHPALPLGLSHEFLGRSDGWKPLAERYGLQPQSVRGIDHTLAYTALTEGDVDVIDVYSTDAKIAEYDLVCLKDDRNFFPRYDAVFLYRKASSPQFIKALASLENTIPESAMVKLNARAEETGNYATAASLYFGKEQVEPDTLLSRTVARLLRHLELVLLSLLLAVVVGIPLGIAASGSDSFGAVILAGTGIIQTIPSLALLALLVSIPFLGISTATAIIALFLYSLLPIVRSTAAGLENIPASLRESAEALGLEKSTQLRKIYLPLASRSILSGVKTSAIINVGTATLAALIGAGGLGEPIISGLNLNDTPTILEGAIPAALLALVVELCFLLSERIFIPMGLRLERKNRS